MKKLMMSILFLTMVGGVFGANLDIPIISDVLIQYYQSKPRVRVDVLVEAATGKGEKVMDFFVVEPGRGEPIPNSLRAIFNKSEFIRLTAMLMQQSGLGVLKITEALSEPGGREKIGGFIAYSGQ